MAWGAADWEDVIGWGHVPGGEAALRRVSDGGAAAAAMSGTTAAGGTASSHANSNGEQWWLYNDSQVKRASLEAVQSDEVARRAYVLVYALKEMYSEAAGAAV
jgi:hypothetical protein